jgi:hypothetical protein
MPSHRAAVQTVRREVLDTAARFDNDGATSRRDSDMMKKETAQLRAQKAQAKGEGKGQEERS